jgi:hypothetical protein
MLKHEINNATQRVPLPLNPSYNIRFNLALTEVDSGLYKANKDFVALSVKGKSPFSYDL